MVLRVYSLFKELVGRLWSLCCKSHGLFLENMTCNETTDTNFGSRSHDQAVASIAKASEKGIKENRGTFEVSKRTRTFQVRAIGGAQLLPGWVG